MNTTADFDQFQKKNVSGSKGTLINSFLNNQGSDNQNQQDDVYNKFGSTYFQRKRHTLKPRNSLLNNQSRRQKIESFFNTKRSVQNKILNYIPNIYPNNERKHNVTAQFRSSSQQNSKKQFQEKTSNRTHSLFMQRGNSIDLRKSIQDESPISLRQQFILLAKKRQSLQKQYQQKQKGLRYYERQNQKNVKKVNQFRSKLKKIQQARQTYRNQKFLSDMTRSRYQQNIRKQKLHLKQSVLQNNKYLSRSRINLSEGKKHTANQIRSDLRMKTQERKAKDNQFHIYKRLSRQKAKVAEKLATQMKYEFIQDKILNVSQEKLLKIQSQIHIIKKQEIRNKRYDTESRVIKGQYYADAQDYKNKIKQAKSKNLQKIKNLKASLGIFTDMQSPNQTSRMTHSQKLPLSSGNSRIVLQKPRQIKQANQKKQADTSCTRNQTITISKQA